MATFILTYNPDLWTWPAADRLITEQATVRGERTRDRWSTGGRRHGIQPGDRWYLFQQGTRGRGLFARGRFLGTIYQDEHWAHAGRLANYADITYDTLLPETAMLPIEEAAEVTEGVHWRHMKGSGVAVSDRDAHALDSLWADHVRSLR